MIHWDVTDAPISFIFVQFSGKIWANNRLAPPVPPTLRLAPRLGNSGSTSNEIDLKMYTAHSILFLGGLSFHLNHFIASGMTIYDWPFGTLPFRLFGSNLDTRDLETYPRTYSGHFWNMSIFDDSRAVWVLFRKWVVSEIGFLDEGAIVTPLSV